MPLFFKSFIYFGLTSLALVALLALLNYSPDSYIGLEVILFILIPWLFLTIYILIKTNFKEISLQKILTIFYGLLAYVAVVLVMFFR